MKGPLAAAVTAIERVVAGHPDHAGSLAVLLTSDEEGVAKHGTAAVVDLLASRGERIDACVVTEATSLERLGDSLKNGRRGSLNGVLTVRGHQAHIAYPHLGLNPVHLAAQAIVDLTTEVWDAGDEYFPPTSFQISNIHAGTGADNVIPGDMQVVFNFRFSPVSPVETLTARVQRILDRYLLDYSLDWRLSGLPFVTPRGRLVDLVADVVQDVAGVRPMLSTGGGTSDARFIAPIATEVIEFGPVNASIHQVDEHILIEDLEPLSRIYETTVRRLLGLQDRP
jgi:succinyl-diaminopimelate desuccinylase